MRPVRNQSLIDLGNREGARQVLGTLCLDLFDEGAVESALGLALGSYRATPTLPDE